MTKFEMQVKDVKTSRVKDDSCPLTGEFEYGDSIIKVKMVFTSDDGDIFDELFGGVGHTVTFSIVENAQQTLG